MKHELTSVTRPFGNKLYVAGEWIASLVVWWVAIGMFLAIVCLLLSLEE
jgi:hypothetical protein